MKVLLKPVHTNAEQLSEKTVSTFASEKDYLESMMMNIIKDEAFRIAKAKVENKLNKS